MVRVQASRTMLSSLTESTAEALTRMGWRDPINLSPDDRMYVCAIGFWAGVCWFYVVDDHAWPAIYPAECFDLIERNIPDNWRVSYGEADPSSLWISPSEFLSPDFETFYERLLNGDKNALMTYTKVKQKIGLS